MEIVDAYTHCGLREYRPIEMVRQVMSGAGVERAVLVQHLGQYDNSYICTIVDGDPDHFAGVCLVDHASPKAGDALEALASSGRFRGVRFTFDSLVDAAGVWEKAVGLELIIVIYAPQGIAECFDSLMAFLDGNPECRLVISHMGNPELREAPHFEAYKEIFTLAKYPGVYYQISGMKMFCPYPHEELYPLIEEAAEHFGASRLLWGSNYPVVGDEKDYVRDLRLLLDGRLPVPTSAIEDIVGGNARRLWFPHVL